MWVFRSATGGAGCTTVAVATSLLTARRRTTLLVDVRGDAPTMLGEPQPEIGLTQWLDASHPPPDALARLEVPVTDRLSILPAGIPDAGPAHVIDPDGGPGAPGGAGPRAGAKRAALLADLLRADERQVVVDVGTSRGWSDRLVDAADRTIVVTRPCYLALARAATDGRACDGVVLIREPARLVRRSDVGQAFGAPVVASLRWDPTVAMAVDVGSLALRLPRTLRSLSRTIARL